MIGRERSSAFILWFGFLALCLLALNNLAQHPIPFKAIDEHGHISYVLHLIQHHRWWPDFSQFMMFDVAKHTELGDPNYINHPPTFYWLMKLAHSVFPWWEPAHYRTFTVVLYLLAMALYTRIGLKLTMPIPASILYALMPLLLYMHLQIGFFNNDGLCVLGGVIATWASLQWFREAQPARAVVWMAIGLLLASVKLTGLLLVGIYVFSCLMQRRSHIRALPRACLVFGIATVLLCIAPYLYFALTLGSPAPTTPGQLALISECLGCPTQGATLHMAFIEWFGFFLAGFANQLSVNEMTLLPILLYAASLVLPAFVRPCPARCTPDTALRAIAIASATATLITLAIHTAFSWQRYRDYGWIYDSILRYYLPLIGAYAAVTSHALTHWLAIKKASHA